MQTTTITILRPGEAAKTETFDLPREPGYHALKRLVEPHLDGGSLEHVSVLHDGEPTDMFLHDEGALIELPRNEPATAIYRANWLNQNPGADPESVPAIYGPAVLFSRRVWF
ncbi:MAG: hypothetical protein DI527_00365 [Chelatococcus sp.]|nr:MAG: hypothetical protein DI527_00365 [Chelatococcus sp.]